MLQVTPQSLGVPPAFTLVPADDNYWLMRWCYEQSATFYEMATTGMIISQVEQSDVVALETDWANWATSMEVWFDTALAEAEAWDWDEDTPVIISSVPAIPGIGGVLVPIIGKIVIPMIMQVAVRIIAKLIEKKINPGTNFEEVAQILRKALLDKNPGNEYYSLLWAIADAGTRIFLTKEGTVDDITFTEPS